MKKHLLTFSVLVLSVCLFSTKTFAQRDAGGYSTGLIPVFELKLTNYPNSFTTTTTIKYDVPADGKVTLKIYNSIGQQITTLVEEDTKSGSYTIEFNAFNMARGIYVCQYSLIVGTKHSMLSRKLLL